MQLKKGILLALATALISGFSIFYNKLVLVKGIDSLVFNIIKNGGTAILLSLILLLIPQNRQTLTRGWSQWKKLLFLGAVGGSLPFFLFFEGLKNMPAVNAALIHKTLFVWVALLALPLLKERLSFWQVIGYLLIIEGNFVIGGFTGFQISKGEVMILAATFLWSVETVIAKKILQNTSALLAAWGRMFFGTLVLIFLAIFQQKLVFLSHLKAEQLTPILASVLFLTGYVIVWYQALKSAPATVVTAVLVLSVPVTNFLTVVFINRNLPGLPWADTFMIIFGVLFVAFFASFIKRSRRLFAPLTQNES